MSKYSISYHIQDFFKNFIVFLYDRRERQKDHPTAAVSMVKTPFRMKGVNDSYKNPRVYCIFIFLKEKNC